MNSRARWVASARNLAGCPEEVANHLTVYQLADETGLSPATLTDPLTRAEITNEDNPRGALCRPAAHFGGEPMWSTDQLDEYVRRAGSRTLPQLNLISPAEAEEKGLASTPEIAELLGVHDQTLRAAQTRDKNYPPALARRSRGGRPGVPEHVRSIAAVRTWFDNRAAAALADEQVKASA